MSDNLGPNQTRVLESDGRNFESLIYQLRKPPLSSEHNLSGQIANDGSRRVASILPSGWSFIGQPREEVGEVFCGVGDYLTSSTFTSNTFKFIALDKGVETQSLIAWVNGWPILVQGTNSPDENNIIVLPPPSSLGSRVDFVFLEVWRKLITPEDTIYRYGNVAYGGTNFQNDLIDPSIGIETSLRIQIQYRIRVAYSDLESYPDGFDPLLVFVQGPLSAPISGCSHAYFTKSPSDPGLWIAGAGDEAAQEILGTVDGHTYAIPLFAVCRRNTGNYNPDSRSNGSGKTRLDYLAGIASDRPDELYNDWVVASDILDMRHRIYPVEDLTQICNQAFNKLQRGLLRTKMSRSLLGEDHFGVNLLYVDSISPLDRTGSTRIGQGDGIRRVFSNAEYEQESTIVTRSISDKTYGTVGVPWQAGDRIEISYPGYPAGTVISSIELLYINSGSFSATISTIPASSVTITILAGSPVIGTSDIIHIDHTVTIAAGPNGFTHVPSLFYEVRGETSLLPVALRDRPIRVRTLEPVSTILGVKYQMLQNHGEKALQLYDFGHQMVYHVASTGITSIINIGRIIEGYPILGVLRATVNGVLRSVSVTRSATEYSINIGSPIPGSGEDIEFILYTGVKFFDTNKQGRAIIDCFEMVELDTVESADGSRVEFHIDSVNKEILAIASYSSDLGYGYVYVNDIMVPIETSNSDLPATLKTYPAITFSLGNTPQPGDIIKVPVLCRSAIGPSEGYNFFYNTLPYQGILSDSITGGIEVEGSSIITTAGSGSIIDYRSQGIAFLTSGSPEITGVGTSWLSTAMAGDEFFVDGVSYIIESVNSDTFLRLTSPAKSTAGPVSVIVRRRDTCLSNRPNVIDRMPSYDGQDYTFLNTSLLSSGTEHSTISTRIMGKIQDIIDAPDGSVVIGAYSASRGRSGVILPENVAPLGMHTLCLRYEDNFSENSSPRRIFQSYILNVGDTGRLVLMVVGSYVQEDDYMNTLDAYSYKDSVDIFEIFGRPLIRKRVL